MTNDSSGTDEPSLCVGMVYTIYFAWADQKLFVIQAQLTFQHTFNNETVLCGYGNEDVQTAQLVLFLVSPCE